MGKQLTAKASTTINASRAKVWDALVNPKTIKHPTEEARQHSEKNWGMMLAGLKKLLEK